MSPIKYDLNIGFVITDNKLNILYCNEYFETNIIKADIVNQKITIFFQDINVDMDNNLYSVKYKDTEYYIVHNKFKLYSYELYGFSFMILQ